MGLIDRLAAFAGFERRDATVSDPSWVALSHGYFAPGLSPRAVENLSAVIAATNAIARALASVPVYVYRIDADGNRVEQPRHPLALMARYGVSAQQTWFDWLEHTLVSVLVSGNSLSIIQRDGRGQLSGLKFVPWSAVSPFELTSGSLVFDVTDKHGQMRRYLESETLFIRDRTDDGGKIGRSVLARAAESVGVVYGTNSLAANTMRNGAFPGGLLTAPGSISNDTAARLKATWETGYSGDKAGRIAVGGDGLDYKPLALSPQTVELLESRKFGIQEIARIFSVPPIFAGDFTSSTFTNAETMVRIFASFGLGQWAAKIQQEFSRSVLSSDCELRLDLSAFLRGDDTARWGTYSIAASQKILTVDEIRAMEGFSPMPNGQGPAPQA